MGELVEREKTDDKPRTQKVVTFELLKKVLRSPLRSTKRPNAQTLVPYQDSRRALQHFAARKKSLYAL